MVVPILIAVGSVLAGALLGVGSQRGRPSGGAWTTEGASALATFALVSALAVVLAQLLPDALAGAGLAALVVFGVAAALPALFERLAARITPGRAVDRVGLELGYAALVLHQVGDGVALGTYGGSHHAGHGHFDVLFAIAAHTVPMIALVSIAFYRVGGARVAAGRAVGLAVASTIGVLLPEVMPTAIFERAEPWLTAAVAGLLLHVVAHDWSAARSDTPIGRAIDLVAVVGAAGLVALSSHDHHGDGSVRERMGTVLADLSLRIAPALLIGLALSALVATWLGPRVSTAALASPRGRLSHALRGAWLGVARPLATARALAGGRALEARGATPALVVAFLFAGPTLGLETLAVTAALLDAPFAIARVVVAGVLAIGIAIGVDVAARSRAPRETIEDDGDALAAAAPEDVGGYPAALLRNFDALLHDVAPWTVVGLLAAAYVDGVLEPDVLPALRAQGLDVLLIPFVALPAYVSAPAATPLAVVLVLGGMSPGAVLAGLVLGPITHLTHIAFVRATWGARAAGAGVIALLGAAIGVAVLFDTVSAPVVPARDAPGVVSIAAAAVLGLAILYRIWRTGVRTWIASVGAWARSDAAAAHAHGPPRATTGSSAPTRPRAGEANARSKRRRPRRSS